MVRFRIQFSSSSQIKELQTAVGRTTNILYLLTEYLLTFWHRLALFNSKTLNVIGGLKRLMIRRFSNAVVWIAELVRVKKVRN